MTTYQIVHSTTATGPAFDTWRDAVDYAKENYSPIDAPAILDGASRGLSFVDAKNELRMLWDGDAYGTAIGACFSIAAEIYFNRDDATLQNYVVDVMQYRPGAAADGPEEDDYLAEIVELLSDADLYRFAIFCERYLSKTKASGLDY